MTEAKRDQVMPRLRTVEAHPVQNEEQMLFVLRDPAGYAPAQVSLTTGAVFLAQLLDGETTFGQALDAFKKHYDMELNPEDLEGLIQVLDDNLLLESPKFFAHQNKVDGAYLRRKTRPFVSFSDDAESIAEVRGLVDGIFAEAGYPNGSKIKPESGAAVGIIAPHIDYLRGGKTYGAAYGRFFHEFDGDTIIVLGTSHQAATLPLALTRKHYKTIFGTVRTDEALVEELATALPYDGFAEEMLHRNEHSVELAATMLAYGGLHKRVKIVPVLASGIIECLLMDRDPLETPTIAASIDALRRLVEQGAGKTAIIASVDFAHIGPQFGDTKPVSDNGLARCRKQDLRSLELLGKGDAAGFVDLITEEQDRRHVCGFSPLTFTAAVLGKTEGELLDYGCWVDEQRQGAVSFAAMILRKPV